LFLRFIPIEASPIGPMGDDGNHSISFYHKIRVTRHQALLKRILFR
jgi:hypothetical protein